MLCLVTRAAHCAEINAERELIVSLDDKGREMAKDKQKKRSSGAVGGWFADTAEGEFKIGLDKDEKHSGSRSAYIKSAVAKPNREKCGNLCQWI